MTMTTSTTYTELMSTGSGSDKITMTVRDDDVRIVIRSKWMGADDVPRRCELLWTTEPLDTHHGVLRLAGAAIAMDDDSVAQPLPPLTGEDAILPLTVEYLHVPPTRRYLHPGSMLATMEPAGYAAGLGRRDLRGVRHRTAGAAVRRTAAMPAMLGVPGRR